MDAASTFGTYLRIAWRKRWLLALPLLLSTAGSVVALQYLPRVYRATTLILVQAPNIPADYVKPTVRTEASRLFKGGALKLAVFQRHHIPTERAECLFDPVI